jgi:hypothetical protein
MLVCGRCGHHNEDSARFCASCDTYLDFSTSRKVQGDEPPPDPAPEAPPEPRDEPAPEPDVWAAPAPDPRPSAAPPGGGWQRQRPPRPQGSGDADLFGGDDDYGTLLDDLAALGYGPSDREGAAATVAREAPPAWPTGGQGQPQQPYRDPPPPPPQRQQPAPQSYAANPAEAVLPQAVQPQKPKPAPQPSPEPAADPDAGIHAVKPGERRHQSVARTTAPEQEQAAAPGVLRPGEATCPRCGRGNPQGTRFCRCGNQLVTTVRPAEPPPRTTTRQLRVPWWRRLLGIARSGEYTPSGNARIQYNRALEVRTQLVRASLLLATLGLGVGMIGPFGLRSWVADQFANITHGYKQVAVQESALVGDAEAPEGTAAEFATDGQTSRVWSVAWNTKEQAVVDEPCSPAPTPAAGALAVTFGQPSRVDRVTVRAGIDRGNKEQASKQAAPRTVDLQFSDGTCQRLELKNDFSKQRFGVKGGQFEGAVVNIVDVYPAADGPGDVVSIAEITFESRGR